MCRRAVFLGIHLAAPRNTHITLSKCSPISIEFDLNLSQSLAGLPEVYDAAPEATVPGPFTPALARRPLHKGTCGGFQTTLLAIISLAQHGSWKAFPFMVVSAGNADTVPLTLFVVIFS